MKFDFQDLIDRKLVSRKEGKDQFEGLYVYKYTKRVFYDALWNEDKRLLDARGMVLNADGEAIIWPFTKVFNYLENGAGEGIEDSHYVQAVRKVNGFMASVRKSGLRPGRALVATTGSLDSEFVQLARRVIVDNIDLEYLSEDYTYIFEICHPSDPHIVEEEAGAYLIGARNMKTGAMMQEDFLKHHAYHMGAKRPEHFNCSFGELKEVMKTCKHEGFMVIDLRDYSTLFKWKSPHYLTKKFIMRMGQNKVDYMFNNKEEFLQSIDEEFYAVVEYITSTYHIDYWKQLSDQDRRCIIENHFEGVYNDY